MKNKKSAVILLSGGLDSYVSLDIAKSKYEISLAITFDYGQVALREEIEASGKIAKQYGIKHKIIKLPFLSEMCPNTLKDIWIPNRNGLFLNIAGCFCDKYGYDGIIFGANMEEAQEFIDNSMNFIKNAQKALSYSTRNNPKIVAPLIKMTKYETILYGIEKNLDFSLIKSCYDSKISSGKKHCSKCPSCKLLKNALKKAQREDLIEKMGF